MRFICTHTVPANAISPAQLNEMARAAQNDPVICGYRSFCNLSEGKAVCIMDAPDKQSLAAWFNKMQMPFDAIVPVEFEGERGTVREVAEPAAAAR